MQTESVLNFTKAGFTRKIKELEAQGYTRVSKDEDHLGEKEYCTNESSIPSDVDDDFAGFQITWRK